jgi:circadian clock protein KaiC
MEEDHLERVSTGLSGLDEILHGGLIRQRAYLVRGGPGTGKTILGLHFLAAGASAGERTLLITIDEPADRIQQNARSVHLDLSKVAFLDLSPSSEFFTKAQSYDIFTPAEVEREPTTNQIVQRIDKLAPQRVFLETLTQLRYFTPDAFQFHKQVLSLLRFLQEHGATVLFSSESSPSTPDDGLQFMSDGVISLELSLDGRCLSVTKFRGSDMEAGSHSLRLTDRGMEVFPRLLPEAHGRPFIASRVRSGVPELDEMLRGGLTSGMTTLITGPSGVGKTSMGVQFMKEAAGRGERSVIYLFEESMYSLIERSEAINIPVRAMLERGTLSLVEVEPLIYSADEFAHLVRNEVEQHDVRIVMIDSIAGYNLCIRGKELIAHMYALTRYLKNMGVTALLVNEIEAITGEFRLSELGISYLADNIIFLRYLETRGELRKAVGVLKQRMSDFERSLRELEITQYGIKVGAPLANLRGILGGTPEFLPPPG